MQSTFSASLPYSPARSCPTAISERGASSDTHDVELFLDSHDYLYSIEAVQSQCAGEASLCVDLDRDNVEGQGMSVLANFR